MNNNNNNLIFYAAGGPSLVVRLLRKPIELFMAFFSLWMMEELVIHTNKRIEEERVSIGPENREKASYKTTTLTEIKALIACLLVGGARKDGHLSTQHMFENLFGTTFYRLLFSEKRFEFLIRCIRMDNRDSCTGEYRFEYCRALWDELMANCKNNYNAGPNVTVDEQLIPFRGNCKFRMYIANKPAKYGIKIFMVCDSKSLYCLNGIPYLGKNSVDKANLRGGVNQGEYFTMKLLENANLFKVGRSVCADNWFISLHLATTLQSKGMYLIGTIRQKTYLPGKNFATVEKLKEQECVAIFDHQNDVNYVIKRKKGPKIVTVLTTIHNRFSYVERSKTEAHMYYNSMKGGVDAFDKIVADGSFHERLPDGL